MAWLIPTFSPQGDGNPPPAAQPSGSRLQLIPTFSPQGDGNECHLISKLQLSTRLLIPTFSPQGDGNTKSFESSAYLLRRLIPTFSPQGDGNRLKPVATVPCLTLIPTFSPQGDGNLHPDHHPAPGVPHG